MVRNWAEHSASAFDGKPRSECEENLKESFVNSLKVGAPVIPELKTVVAGFSWDEENRISVETDPEKVTDEMLVIRGQEWLG